MDILWGDSVVDFHFEQPWRHRPLFIFTGSNVTFGICRETLTLLPVLHVKNKNTLFKLSSLCMFGPFWIVIFTAAQIFQNCPTHNVVLIRQFASARWDACRELFGSFQCVIWTKQLNQWASLWCSLWGLLSNGSYNGRAAEPGSSVLCVMVMLGGCFWAGRECVWNKKVCVL